MATCSAKTSHFLEARKDLFNREHEKENHAEEKRYLLLHDDASETYPRLLNQKTIQTLQLLSFKKFQFSV